ncbi:MAG: methyltransferase [Bacteroidales bacterium]|nr:methyltransferase [Bacteroidales bacterium]
MTDARPFHFKHFSLYHHRSTMKVGTDAILLGRWTEVKPTDVVLDIGTGCGLLPLMLAQKGVAQVDAVDIDQASIEEATVNFEASQWRDQLHAFCIDINDFQPRRKFDLIVSNPPFFNRYSKCDEERKSRARHNDMSLSYASLCAVARRLLKPDGRFALVLPVDVSKDFLQMASRSGFFLHKRLTIIPIEGKEPNRFNLEFGFGKCDAVVEESFVIRAADKRFTSQYNAFLKDYYLGL